MYMETATPHPRRTGWAPAEEELLFQAVARCRAKGEPLQTAFSEAARKTGRRPNSVRNHYYAQQRASQSARTAFLPFSEEESLSLLRTVLLARSTGESVRSCTLRIADGDMKKMLRYQNKYRSLIKSRPALVEQVRQELLSGGATVFDPYAPETPGPGRPKKSPPTTDTHALLSTLCDTLTELLRRSLEA